MEDMRPVFVNMDAVLQCRIDIARDVVSFLHDKAGLSLLLHFMRKDRAIETGSDDQIIVHLILR